MPSQGFGLGKVSDLNPEAACDNCGANKASGRVWHHMRLCTDCYLWLAKGIRLEGTPLLSDPPYEEAT